WDLPLGFIAHHCSRAKSKAKHMNEHLKVLSLRGSFEDALLFRFATQRERELASRARGNLSRLAFNSHFLRCVVYASPSGPALRAGLYFWNPFLLEAGVSARGENTPPSRRKLLPGTAGN